MTLNNDQDNDNNWVILKWEYIETRGRKKKREQKSRNENERASKTAICRGIRIIALQMNETQDNKQQQ